MTGSRTIFIVEDDIKIGRIVADSLASEGHSPRVFQDARTVVAQARTENPAAIVLDIMLPAGNGIDLCRQLRDFYSGPVIMLTARVEEADKLEALNIGADDYVMKPFSPRELVARVNAQIRRSEGRMTANQERRNLIVDQNGQRISWHGQWLELSPSEFCLLSVLSKSPGRIYSRAQLLDHLGDQTIETGERAIDSHVKNIRRKLGAINASGGGIVAVYGAGYKFGTD